MSVRSSLLPSRPGPPANSRHSRRAGREKHAKPLPLAPMKTSSTSKAPSRTPVPLKIDLEKLRQLKELIRSGSHPSFTAVPKLAPSPTLDVSRDVPDADSISQTVLSIPSQALVGSDGDSEHQDNVESVDCAAAVIATTRAVVDGSTSEELPKRTTAESPKDMAMLIMPTYSTVRDDVITAAEHVASASPNMLPVSAPPAPDAALSDFVASSSPYVSSKDCPLLPAHPVVSSEESARHPASDSHERSSMPKSSVLLASSHPTSASSNDIVASPSDQSRSAAVPVEHHCSADEAGPEEGLQAPLEHPNDTHFVEIVKQEDSAVETKTLLSAAAEISMADVPISEAKQSVDIAPEDAKARYDRKAETLSLRERIGPLADPSTNATRHPHSNRGRRARGRSQTGRFAQQTHRPGSYRDPSPGQDSRSFGRSHELSSRSDITTHANRPEGRDRLGFDGHLMTSHFELEDAGQVLPQPWGAFNGEEASRSLRSGDIIWRSHLPAAPRNNLPNPYSLDDIASGPSLDGEVLFQPEEAYRVARASVHLDNDMWAGEDTSRRSSGDQHNLVAAQGSDQYVYGSRTSDDGRYLERDRFRSRSPDLRERDSYYPYGLSPPLPSNDLSRRATGSLPFARRSPSPLPPGRYSRSPSPDMLLSRPRYQYSRSPPLVDQYHHLEPRFIRSPRHVPLAARLSDPYDRRPVDDLSLAPYGHADNPPVPRHRPADGRRRSGSPFGGQYEDDSDKSNQYPPLERGSYYAEDATAYDDAEAFHTHYPRYNSPPGWSSYDTTTRVRDPSHRYDYSHRYPPDTDTPAPHQSSFYR